jgi:asparagine synthase (glutamine-hydrolysing)
MCGIIAIVSFKNHKYNLSRLDKMAKMIAHRGPDDEGYALFDIHSENYSVLYGDDTPRDVIGAGFHYSPVRRFKYPSESFTIGLAHRRLSIIDLTSSGHQPMCDETGRYWITYNGEIYNFKDIRDELRNAGHSFFSNTDTEVVLKSYIEWGKDCQSKFNGMWAFVIWDNYEKRLWISRDRFGVKPLYYMFDEGFLIVCSEIKSIIPIHELTPNLQEIYSYFVDGPSEAHKETFFNSIYRFPSGCSATYSLRSKSESLVFDKYWELDHPSKENSFSTKRLKEYTEEYLYLLRDAVKIRLYADVKVSCALSGGLDSSSITYLAYQILKDQGKSTDALMTVSNVYKNKDYSDCDESEFIDHMVNKLNIINYRSEPDIDGIAKKNDDGLWYYENCYDYLPFSGLNTFEICKRNNIKVNLDGQGADETVAGYPRYWKNYFATQPIINIDFLLSLFNAPIKTKKKIRYIFRIGKIRKSGLFYEEIFKNINDSCRRANHNKNKITYRSINQELHHDTLVNLKDRLRKVDFYSMFSSIESRQPFMDYRLISFLNGIPSTYKMKNGWTKYLARMAFKGKLPDDIVWRKDKLGWPQPTKELLSGEFGSIACNSINKSVFLREEFGGISDKNLNLLKKYPRYFFRLYNMVRHYEVFFNKRH